MNGPLPDGDHNRCVDAVVSAHIFYGRITTKTTIYVMLGKFFSGRVEALIEILGNLGWVIIGLIVALILGWKLMQYLRPAKTANVKEIELSKPERGLV